VSYGTSITVDLPFPDAVARVRDALKGQGFGVLTEIDVTATLRDKLGGADRGLRHPGRLQPAVRPSGA